MTVIKTEIERIKNHLGYIKPPMPAFMYDDIIGLFPRDEQGSAVGESCVDVLRRHLSTEIGEIENRLFAIETQVSVFEERLASTLKSIEKLNIECEEGFAKFDCVAFDDEKDAELFDLKHRMDNGIRAVYEELRFAKERWGDGR